MPDIIIADTTCFIILTKIDELSLLKDLYGNIYTTQDIAAEFDQHLPDWVNIRTVTNTAKQRSLEQQVDKGEASAIALALELPNSTIILDDLKGRKLAEELGIKITGTIGIIIKAKLQGSIPSIVPLIDKIKQTNFRLSAAIVKNAFDDAGE